jgi:hypothetical protein
MVPQTIEVINPQKEQRVRTIPHGKEDWPKRKNEATFLYPSRHSILQTCISIILRTRMKNSNNSNSSKKSESASCPPLATRPALGNLVPRPASSRLGHRARLVFYLEQALRIAREKEEDLDSDTTCNNSSTSSNRDKNNPKNGSQDHH